MAFLAPAISALSGIVGIATGIKSLFGKKEKVPEPAKLPAVPTAEDAEAKAQAEIKKRRRISFLSGGQTNITRGQALVSEANLGRTELLGA